MKPPISTPIGKRSNRGKSINKINKITRLERVIFWDTEAEIERVDTKKERHTMKLVVWRYLKLNIMDKVVKDDYGYAYTIEDFVDYLVKCNPKNTHLHLVCHNASYDVQISGILQELFRRGYQVKSHILEFPPFVFTVVRGKHKITLLDSMNYVRVSLASLGKSIGIPKMDYDYYRRGVDQTLIEYALNDVKILSEWFMKYYKFLIDNRLSPFGYTLASQAFRTYRYRFLSQPIPLHRVQEVLAIERFGYVGGRVECFRIGDFDNDTYYKLDVNSMYPFVMSEKQYPTVYLGYIDNPSQDKLYNLHKTHYLIAQVDIETNVGLYPLRLSDRVIYPKGQFSALLHSGELDLCLRYALNYRVQRVYIYKKADIFSDYIKYFYDMKLNAEEKGDAITRNMAKLLMNSLYGKFGQAGYEDIHITKNNPDNQYYRYKAYSQRLGKEVVIDHINGVETTTIRKGESYYSYPAIAGAVTSYARAYLAELMLTTGFDQLYYVDTDSLIVSETGYKRLSEYIDNFSLGYLKIEGITDSVSIHGLKDYRFGDTVKIKGVSRNAVKVDTNAYQYMQFRGAKTWLRSGGESEVLVEQRIKTLKHEYRKGVIIEDYVQPYLLPDLTITPLILPKSV